MRGCILMENVLLLIICYICVYLIIAIPDLLLQDYIEKNVKEKHINFSKSKWTRVRKYCAFYGYDLEKLQYDKKWDVRIEVVRKKYSLNKFLTDDNILVRKEAERIIRNKEIS